MLTLNVLGEDLPAIATAHPVYYSGHHRQTRDAHIVIGAKDVTPGAWFGYDWECTITAYRAWNPGRHGTSCDSCPAGDQCGHLQDEAHYDDTWGAVLTDRFRVRTGADTLAQRRFDPDRLTRAVQAADAALTALPPSPLGWTAYGPKHTYGHYATEQQARDWLVGHMRHLAADPNLGERRQIAARNAALLGDGATEVQIGAKHYGIRVPA